MNLTLLASLISAALAAAAGFGAAWTWQGRAIDLLKLEAKDAIIQQQRVARQSIDRALSQVSQAQADAQVRTDGIRRAAGDAAAAGNGLRDTSAATVRAAADHADTCAAIVSAYDTILAEGRGFIQEVAAEADRCFSDVQTLKDAAWPK